MNNCEMCGDGEHHGSEHHLYEEIKKLKESCAEYREALDTVHENINKYILTYHNYEFKVPYHCSEIQNIVQAALNTNSSAGSMTRGRLQGEIDVLKKQVEKFTAEHAALQDKVNERYSQLGQGVFVERPSVAVRGTVRPKDGEMENSSPRNLEIADGNGNWIDGTTKEGIAIFEEVGK